MTSKPLFGIDFGTTTSAVSWWNPKSNAPEIIRNEHGDEKTPSVVYRGEDELLIGKPAWEQLHDVGQMAAEEQAAVFGRTFLSVKRMLKENAPLALPGGEIVTPVELAADILTHLKESAERGCFNGEKVQRVSLSHPVIFNKTEKERLKEAASLAGFKECRLIEEPLAAIHGYLASGAKAGNNILVFDMGGGTLDLAFLCRDGNEYHMPIPPMGEEAGGDEFDRVLYNHFDRKLEQEHGIRFGENGSCNLAVLGQCRKLKEKLTLAKKARLSHFISKANIHASFDMVRDELESLIRDQVDRAAMMAGAMLGKVQAGGFHLDTVLLVGGSTRIPMVRKQLADILPIEPVETMHTDVAVAMGCGAVHAIRESGGANTHGAVAEKPPQLTEDELLEYRQSLLDLRGQVVDGISFLAGNHLSGSDLGASIKQSEEGEPKSELRGINDDREFTLNLISSEKDILYEIDEALRRIDAGTYGVCEITGEPIERERLQMIPYTRFIETAQPEDKQKNLPPEPVKTMPANNRVGIINPNSIIQRLQKCAAESRPRDYTISPTELDRARVILSSLDGFPERKSHLTSSQSCVSDDAVGRMYVAFDLYCALMDQNITALQFDALMSYYPFYYWHSRCLLLPGGAKALIRLAASHEGRFIYPPLFAYGNGTWGWEIVLKTMESPYDMIEAGKAGVTSLTPYIAQYDDLRGSPQRYTYDHDVAVTPRMFGFHSRPGDSF
jgi:RNA polymerase-binding transcription factor DksA/actin-like ATPase involved in cell morphogenesis